MWFRNRYLHEFAELFLRLGEADWILEGRLYHDPQTKAFYHQNVENEFFKISKLFTPRRFYDDLLYNLLDELENDFYKYPDERYPYLKDIISYFVHIMPYIEKYTGNTHFTNHLPQFRTEYATYFKINPEYSYPSNNANIWGKSPVELYVISCISVMDKFSTFLDTKCLDFNIDMEDIQRDLGIFLFRSRNYTSLYTMGYGNKINSILNIRPTFEQKHGLQLPPVTQNNTTIQQISPVQVQKAIETPKQPQTTTTVSTITTKKSEPAEEKIEVNVFCKDMPFHIPKEYFKILKEKKSTNGEAFLTEEQFNAFINRAFYGKPDIPKQKLNQSRGERLLLQAVFYDFYFDYCEDYFNTLQCRDQFIRLLTENFYGWEFKRVKANFKPKTDKRL